MTKADEEQCRNIPQQHIDLLSLPISRGVNNGLINRIPAQIHGESIEGEGTCTHPVVRHFTCIL